MGTVYFVNGIVLAFLGLLSAGVALVYPDTRALFGESTLFLALIGLLVVIATGSRVGDLSRRNAFLLTTSVWLVAALGGALPLYLWGMTPVDALFEAMSGITTTGSTVIVGLDALPRGILLWRALLQGLGGVGFIVVGIALLPMLRIGGMQLFRTESSDRGDKAVRSAGQFALATLAIYAGLILLCALLYHLGGMSEFDAITHAMTTLSTGGYSNYDASFGHFDSAYLQWVSTVFMLMGALPFAWYIRAFWQGRFQSEQVRAMLMSLAGVIALLTVWLLATSDLGAEEALRTVAFSVVSVVTTTGFATSDYTTWGHFSVAIFVVLMATGGCTGSTSGGIKVMRWVIAYRSLMLGLRRVRFPHLVQPLRYEGANVGDDVLAGVISFFTFYALVLLVLTMSLALMGVDTITAVTGAMTSLGNVGPGAGEMIGPAGNFAPLPDDAKLVLSAGMYLGRLEMLTVLVLLVPSFWQTA